MKKSGIYESERKISNDNIKMMKKQSFDILKEFAICNNFFIIQNKEPVDNNKNNILGNNNQPLNININNNNINNYNQYYNNQENNEYNINALLNKTIFFC